MWPNKKLSKDLKITYSKKGKVPVCEGRPQTDHLTLQHWCQDSNGKKGFVGDMFKKMKGKYKDWYISCSIKMAKC